MCPNVPQYSWLTQVLCFLTSLGKILPQSILLENLSQQLPLLITLFFALRMNVYQVKVNVYVFKLSLCKILTHQHKWPSVTFPSHTHARHVRCVMAQARWLYQPRGRLHDVSQGILLAIFCVSAASPKRDIELIQQSCPHNVCGGATTIVMMVTTFVVAYKI